MYHHHIRRNWQQKTTTCHTHRSSQLARTCNLLLSVIFPAAMGWTPECQKKKWDNWTLAEWREWIQQINTRFGRYTKEGWSDWVDRMLDEHGEPKKATNKGSSSSSQVPPAQGPPAQGPPPAKLKGKAECCMEIADDTGDEKTEGVWKELSEQKKTATFFQQ